MFNYAMIKNTNLEYFPVTPVNEFPPGERLFLEITGRTIVVINIAGEYFAIADICSHDNGPVGDGEIEGAEIICPRHGARFDIQTGRATSLPAVKDIPAYPVRVIDGMLEIGIPAVSE